MSCEIQERERQRRLYQMYNGTDILNTVKANELNDGGEPDEFIYKGAALSNGIFW